MAKNFSKLPSEIMEIKDEYTAFCFNEACSYIYNMMTGENPQEPNFHSETVHVKSMSEFYSSMEGRVDNV